MLTITIYRWMDDGRWLHSGSGHFDEGRIFDLPADLRDDVSEALSGVIDGPGSYTVQMDGSEYRVDVEAPRIEIVKIGSAFDLPDDCEQDAEMEWYGTVSVSINGVEYEVGAVIGVPECERGTCRAARAGVRPHLTAWYADAFDWSCAPASNGSAGVPQQLARDVIDRIAAAAPELWRQIQ